MKLRIDQREVELDGPASIHEAALRLGIDIPTLCHDPALDHFTSCMICRVKDKTSGRLLPACSAPAADGMDIETNNAEIRAFRKATLELLLSDHVGDCDAPCQCLCPLHMDIPRMIRAIQHSNPAAAIRVVRENIAIPSILERFCNVPCERGCRRGKHDAPLSIRELTRHVADADLRSATPWKPPRAQATGKRIAIIGAGATGLSAAYYLGQRGHDCVIFEKTDHGGGRIAAEFGRAIEPWVVEGELAILRELGVALHFGLAMNDRAALRQLQAEFHAILLACGQTESLAWDEPRIRAGMKVDPLTGNTGVPGIFAAGSFLKPRQPLVKSVAAAQQAAVWISRFLDETHCQGAAPEYNHTMGRLIDGEMHRFVANAASIPRAEPPNPANGITAETAKLESTRCFHCDCRANDDCKLRCYSAEYGARQGQFAGETRRVHTQILQQQVALYEPGKCIKCGLCVRQTQQAGERFGFAFVGRGFDVQPGVALGRTLSEGLGAVAKEVIDTCPTGALADPEM